MCQFGEIESVGSLGVIKFSGSQTAWRQCRTKQEDPRYYNKKKKQLLSCFNISTQIHTKHHIDQVLIKGIIQFNYVTFYAECNFVWLPHCPVEGDRAQDSPQVDDAPHVCAEPQSRALIGLVLADEDGMRNRQQTHQSPVLQKLQDLRLVRQTSRRTTRASSLSQVKL